jgi:hypothetical protein
VVLPWSMWATTQTFLVRAGSIGSGVRVDWGHRRAAISVL